MRRVVEEEAVDETFSLLKAFFFFSAYKDDSLEMLPKRLARKEAGVTN